MGAYPALSLTSKGRALYAKVAAGATFTVARVDVGSGVPQAPVNIDAMTALVDPKYQLSIDSIVPDTAANICYVNVSKSNALVSPALFPNGVAIKEIGIIATDPDLGNILYAYAYQGAAGMYDILPPSSYGAVNWGLKLSVLVDNAANVALTLVDGAEQYIKVTGTVPATGPLTISYPTGFTQDNCAVIKLLASTSGTDKLLLYPDTLTATGIKVTSPPAASQEFGYELVLLKHP